MSNKSSSVKKDHPRKCESAATSRVRKHQGSQDPLELVPFSQDTNSRRADEDIERGDKIGQQVVPQVSGNYILRIKLIDAVQCGNIEEVERLIKDGASPNSCDAYDMSACHWAAAKSHKALSVLLRYGADTKRMDRAGATPLHVAAAVGNCEQIAILLGLPIDFQDRLDEARPFNYNADLVNLKCGLPVPKLTYRTLMFNTYYIQHHVEDFQAKLSRWTPLHVASAYACPQSVRVLLAAGADPCACDEFGRTPLDVAGTLVHSIKDEQITDVLRILTQLEYNKTFQKGLGRSPLCAAVDSYSFEGSRILVEAGMPVNWADADGLTALHHFVNSIQNVQYFEILLKGKCDDDTLKAVNIKDKRGRTVLHLIIERRWKEGITLALQYGADITAKDGVGDNVLHFAASSDLDILNMIINEVKNSDGINIDDTNKSGESPLFTAIRDRNVNCVKRILDEGASTEIINIFNEHILHVAAKLGSYDIFQVVMNLLDKKIENKEKVLRRINKNGFTVLDLAIESGNENIINLLIQEVNFLTAKTVANIFEYFTKPITIIERIFNRNIMFITDKSVRIDYTALGQERKEQMKVIRELITSGDENAQKTLLTHPLVESFLHLTWNLLQWYFWAILIIYGFFVISLNAYIMAEFHYNDIEVPPYVLNEISRTVFLALVVILIIILEGVYLIRQWQSIIKEIKSNNQMTVDTSLRRVCYLSRQYFWRQLSLEQWVKLSSICLALILLIAVPVVQEVDVVWLRCVAAVALFLSWLEMMFLLSRFPKWGIYVLMFGKVASNVIKILFSFTFLIIGFALSFMILLHSTPPYENYWTALVKILVMMTSEFDYGDLIAATEPQDDLAKENIILIEVLRFLFVVFLILIAIVLMNLMVGVAVDDIQNLKKIGISKTIEKQIEIIELLEKVLPAKIKRHNHVISKFEFENDSNEGSRKLPERLREAIWKIAGLKPKLEMQTPTENQENDGNNRQKDNEYIDSINFQNVEVPNENMVEVTAINESNSYKIILNDLDEKLKQIENKVNSEFENINHRIHKLENTFSEVNSKMDTICQLLNRS